MSVTEICTPPDQQWKKTSPVVQIYRNIGARHDFNDFLLSIRANINKQDTKGCESKVLKGQDTTDDSGACSTALQIHKCARIWLDIMNAHQPYALVKVEI